MSGVRDKLRHLKYRLKYGLSIENVVLVVAIVICLVWTGQSVAAMSRNWELTERLDGATGFATSRDRSGDA